jgi:microbial collagenase
LPLRLHLHPDNQRTYPMIISISKNSVFRFLFRGLIPAFLLLLVSIHPAGAQGQHVCSLDAVKGLTGSALTDYLKASDYNCLRFLWTYNNDIGTVYSDANMLTALTELELLAPDYQANNDQGILGIMLFVHVGYFHDFNKSIQLGSTVKQALIPMSDKLVANTNLTDYLSNDDAATFLNEWVQTIDVAGLAGSYIAAYTEILRVFENHFEQFSTIPGYQPRNAHYGVLFSLQRARSHNFNGKLTQDLIGRLGYLAANTNIPDSYNYIPINGVWTLGRLIGNHPAVDSAIVSALTNALDSQPELSVPWLWVVKALDQFNNCETSRPGESLCFSDASKEVLGNALPHTYYFDDGTVVIKTPLDYDTVQTLYHAMKEVQGQFNRITESITPLPRDPNGALTMIVYGSREDYENYQPMLFDLGTDNGGIYIEGDGTFYTYQRTSRESIYTLEELLRHEFVHYLAGRFTIQGLWNQTPMYNNNQLVWFDEGLAEFLAGSSSRNVDTRENIVRQIRSDSTRLSVDQILTSSYGSFIFYRYAALFFDYLYNRDISTLRQLFRLVRGSDVAGYEALILQMRNDPNLENAYQAYLNEQVARYDSLANPVTHEPLLDQLDSNDIAVIETEFRKTRLGYSGDCSVASTQLNPRFSCRGVLTGPARNSSDADLAWRNFDRSLNSGIIQEALRKSSVNNLHYLNCRMGPIQFLENASGQFYPRSDYYCDGPLAAGTYPLPNRADRATTDFQSTRLGETAVCQSISNDEVECEVTLSLREQNGSVIDSAPAPENTSVLEIAQPNAQLDKVTADFHSTRFGAYAACELTDNNSKISCEMGRSTILFSESDPDQDVYDHLDASLITTEYDVFIINSDFYSGLSCNYIAGSARVIHRSDGKFGNARALCTVDVRTIDYFRSIPQVTAEFQELANDQLEQVTADFKSTRLGVYATCELTDNFSTISCGMGRSTILYSESDPDQNIYDDLDAGLITTEYDVFLINADFYSGLSCNYIAGSARVIHRSDGKYGTARALCTLDVQDPALKGKADKDLVKLQNQVYAIHPAFYRDLSCGFSGSARAISRSENKNNIVRDVVCSIPANDDPLPVSNYFRINPQTNVQLKQVTADFKSTRLGAYAACELTDDYSTVSCKIGRSTIAFLESVPDQDVYDYLDADLVVLRKDVFNINPDYYSGLSCGLVAGSTWISHYTSNGVDYKYGLGDALCTVDVQLP